MLKLVVCQISSPYGNSKVQNTSLRFCGRELGPILYLSLKGFCSEFDKIKENKQHF